MIKISRLYSKHEISVVILIIVMLLTPVLYLETSFFSVWSNIGRIVSSILYTLPIAFLLASIKNRVAFAIFSFVVMATLFIETMMVVLYNGYITAGNILAIMTTTSDEGVGFIYSILNEIPKALPILFLWGFCVYIHKGNTHISSNIILCVMFSLLSSCFLVYQLKIKWKGDITTRFYIEQNVLGRPPYNFVFQTVNACEQLHNRQYIKQASNMKYGAHKPHCDTREAYVLYIGESLRYASLSLGEYHRSTTPLLESLENVTLYSNYYSTANLTMYSVPQILTRATADDFSLNYKEKGIFQPFEECGFRTYVICAGNLLTDEKYLSDGCDSLYTLGTKGEERMAIIIDSLVNIYDKTFFIVQGVGNHSPYTNFRKQQDKYHPNPVSDKVSWDNHEAMVNAYDNTVLFTDYNAYNIIKGIDKPGILSAFMMVSDHGADYDTGVSDHGGNCNPHINEYHVPLIFWHSKTWGNEYPNKMKNVIKHKDMPVNADNVFYSVCDMAEITISPKYAKPEWSIFSDRLELHERKLLVPDGKTSIVAK